MLEYDNSAFYYFSFTFLALTIIPAAYYTIKDVFAALKPGKAVADEARTSLEKEKIKHLAKEQSPTHVLTTWTFIGRLVYLAIAVVAVAYLLQLIQTDDQIAQFNPYAILGLEVGANDRAIKKAYRALSLEYHPDKNPGNQTSLDIFLKVAKAYEALTDPIAKRNWEEFGNPDGKQALEVSIGLPTFLLDQKNHSYILVIYLLCMVVIIPSLVGLWYANSKQYGDKNVMYKTYGNFYQLLSENHRLKLLPEVLSAAQEFFEINAPRISQKEDLLRLLHQLKQKQMPKPKHDNNPVLLKGTCLIYTHVVRARSILPEQFSKDLEKMLMRTPELMEAMIEMCWQRQWLQTTLSAIRFNQCLVQALWPTESGPSSAAFLQLPHFTEAEVKHVTSGKGSRKTLDQYLKLLEDSADKSATKGLRDLTEEQIHDVFAMLKLLPRVKLEAELFVEEEVDDESVKGDFIAERDLITARVTLTRTNLEEGEHAAPVHAPFFPRPLKERWWVIMTDSKERLHAVEKVTSQERVVKVDLKFLAPPTAGTYDLQIHALPDCYMGLDQELSVEFKVNPASELPEYKPHPEDLELDNEPTLFEQVMSNANEDDSDSDEEEEEEEEAEAAGEKADDDGGEGEEKGEEAKGEDEAEKNED